MIPSVFVILLNWNNWQDTAACMDTCLKLSYENFHILVVDNGSTDGSESVLRTRFPHVHFLQTGANLGFAGGNNAGIRYALEHEADYVWLLNNDTVVGPAALAALVTAAEEDPAVGMVGSKILHYDEPELLWYAGGVIAEKTPYKTAHRGLRERDLGQYDAAEETGFVTGCSLLVRRKVIESVGMLADELFLYFEDVDWNARAKASGWKIKYCPQSIVLHKVSASTGGAESAVSFYYSARNLLYFVKRNYPQHFLEAAFYDLFQYVLVNLKKGRPALARAAAAGIADFFRGRMGKRSNQCV